ncbi:uncharacterized protein LOC112539423 [Tetranychus urticae]|uniref:Decapping nuclease n=1 Tax=Tetranychus urticae TaxID=32264 RepID=T1KUF3_TETUR|nr:uncharacterized protein LOC112539423 [Tetranychus urticae]
MFLSQPTLVHKELDLEYVYTDHDICLKGPTRLGFFSFYCNDEKESVYCPDKSSLRYLDLPNPLYINSLQGYDPNANYRHKKSKNKNLLRWILENETIVRNFTYDFISNDGVLKDIMTSSYNDFDWNICAVKIRGKIVLARNTVLNRIASFEKEIQIDARSEMDNKSLYVATNLQRLITKNNNHPEFASWKEYYCFYGVFHSNIGSHGIIHAGYLDCVESQKEMDKPFDEMKFVLIKKHNSLKLSYSSLQAYVWWSLATLAGVDKIIHAKCEQDFRVKNTNQLIVSRMLPRERQKQLFTTLNLVLDFVKSIVKVENQYYNFYFNCTNRKLTGNMRMEPNDNIIPSWFIDGQLPKP